MVKDLSCSLTYFLNELESLTVVVESFKLFHSVDALYVIDFQSTSLRGRGITNDYITLRQTPQKMRALLSYAQTLTHITKELVLFV